MARATLNIHVPHFRYHTFICMYIYMYIARRGLHHPRRQAHRVDQARSQVDDGPVGVTLLGELHGDSHRASKVYQHRIVVGEPRQRAGAQSFVTSCLLRCPRAWPLNWPQFSTRYAFQHTSSCAMKRTTSPSMQPCMSCVFALREGEGH